MARPRKPTTHTSLVASAVRLPAVKRNQAVGGQSWQSEAWRFYDRIGELRFIANWVGNVMSRAELIVVHPVADSDERVEDGPAFDTLEAYYNGQMGQQAMLQQTGVHLTVAGECYHVYRDSDSSWYVLATGHVRQQGVGASATLVADIGEDGGPYTLQPKDFAMRVWNPHPLNPMLADSPTRAVLSVLSEIERCDLHIQATLNSRLAGAGIFLLPQEITFPIPEGADPNASSADVLMQVLGEAMMTPIEKPGDASAVVPIVLQAPGEFLDQAKHITFWGDVSDAVRTMREAAVTRLALGMDIPPEVLLGMTDTNHWSAWLVDEAGVKVHIEPRLAVVANAITTAYLRPALEDTGVVPKDFGVAADTTSIRLRPNRSKEALELWDRGELSSKALLRETGFEPEDAPDAEEFKAWLLRKISLGSTQPEQTVAALENLGVLLPPPGTAPIPISRRVEQVPTDTPTGPGAPTPGRASDTDPRRSLDQHPNRNPPDEALIASCDVLVWRALERAGNRLKSATNYTGARPATDIYLDVVAKPERMDVLVADAWQYADRVLTGFADDPEGVQCALDGYVRHLLATQTRHSRERLRMVLAPILSGADA